MMVPDREIIMKVKLCSVGYSKFPWRILARKFFVLYNMDTRAATVETEALRLRSS